MCSLDPALVAVPLVVQIRYMRDQLDFLKSLDESPMYDPGVLQMDGDIGDTGILPTDGSLPAEAVKYIRSAASARNSWWPAHGMELDIWCLTTGVVNEERLFEEWTASSAPAGDRHNFFEAELQEPLRVAVTSRRSFNRVIADEVKEAVKAAATEAGDRRRCRSRRERCPRRWPWWRRLRPWPAVGSPAFFTSSVQW